MASKKENKRVFSNVTIYGFDPNQEPNKFGQFQATLYISQEQKEFIDSFIYGKCETNRDGEIIYNARSKQKIPLFDAQKNKLEEPVFHVFIADVSLLFDEFVNDKEETIHYIKCLGVKYLSKVENKEARIYVKEEFETFEDIFGDDSESSENQFSAMKPKEEIGQAVTPSPASTFEPTVPPMDDLPF